MRVGSLACPSSVDLVHVAHGGGHQLEQKAEQRQWTAIAERMPVL